MTEHFLTAELRDYLAAAGVVRKANASGTLPTCWVEPAGAPEPGTVYDGHPTGDVTVSLFLSGGVSLGQFASPVLDRPTVDVVIRSHKVPSCYTVGRALTLALAGLTAADLGDLHVEWARVWRPLQRQEYTAEGGYVFSLAVGFLLYQDAYLSA